MTREDINERLALLYLVLQFSSQKTQLLKVGERIMINQERGTLLYKLDYPKALIKPVSEAIEKKIKEIDRLVQVYDFHPLNPIEIDETI